MANTDSTTSLRNQKPKPRINSLLSIWYGIVIGILQAYLIFQSVRKFVWFAELSWPYQKTPFIELNIYIALIGVAVLMLPFFLATSFLRIGNTANDNGLLGRHLNFRDEWAEFLLPNMLYQGTHGFFRTIWTHSGPTASLIHVISSFCLLLPQTVMEAILVKYGHLSKDTLWTTDMDFMVSQRDRNAVLKILSLGEVENKLIGEQNSLMDHTPGVIRVEFFNYALALFVFAIRYANVFWFTNKAFSILFSIQLIMTTVHTLISFFMFTILYKLHVFGPEKILHKNLPFLLNHHVTLLLYVISITILLASSGVFYHYGYLKIASFVRHRAKSQLVTNDPSGSGTGWAYFPHCSALAVLLALTASQSSLVHDATLLYRLCLDLNLLVYVVSVVIFMLLWILTWLGLTVKSKWNCQLNVNVGSLRIRDLDALKLTAEIALSGPADHNKPNTPLASSMLVINEGHAFEVSDLELKRNILENLLKNSQLKREGDSVERIYWPRSCPVSGTQNSLEPEEQPWLKESNDASTPCKNKVTFQDDLLSPRRFATTPVPRTSALKGSYRDISYTQRRPNNIDEGDYALLRCGRNPLNRTGFQEANPEENQALLDIVPAPPRHHQMMPVHANLPMNSMVPNTSLMQGTPRSTDSGYNGTGSSSASCSDSRSTTSSNSPPDRTANTDYSSVSKPIANNCCPQIAECGCDQPTYNINQSIYGKIGLTRKDSIRSHIEPIYESKRSCPIYEPHVMQMPKESIYGDNLKNRSLQSPNNLPPPPPPNENSECHQPISAQRHEQEYGRPVSNLDFTQEKQNSIANSNSEYGMTIHRKSSLRRSLTNNDTTIQNTPYGRCTNIKINPFNDQSNLPPVPPPLPPLSFTTASPNGGKNQTAKNNNNSFRTSRDFTPSTNFVSPSNFSSHHTTIPNHVNLLPTPTKSSPNTSNTFSTFYNTSNSASNLM